MSALNSLRVQRTLDPVDHGDSTDISSYEYCENAFDDASYISCSSVDCLSVIEEETEEDIWNEASRRDTRSPHSRSVEELDDLPPAPPVQTPSQEFQRMTSQNSQAHSPDSVQAHSCRSQFSTNDSLSCFSAPLNDVEEDFHVGGSPGRMERTVLNKTSSAVNRLSLISIETGEQLLSTPSDDEYTFVSCTTIDDMSVSDLGSSHHSRAAVDLLGMDENLESGLHRRSPQSSINKGPCTRRGSGYSVDADSLLPIPENTSSQGPIATSTHQPLCCNEVQRKLEARIANNQLSLSPIQEDETAKSNRLAVLKHRLRLEHYSGVRRRKAFERSKEQLGMNLDNIMKTPRPVNLLASSSSALHATTTLPSPEVLALFGGMTRRERFKANKDEFEKKFDKEMKPLVFRRRRSLSPDRHQPFFDQKEFVMRMTKSDGHLLSKLEDLGFDAGFENEKSADDLVVDPMLEKKFRERKERFGGLRRRNSYSRSRRVLTLKFERIQARSSEGMDRFGDLQRMRLYEQSRVLFEEGRSLLELSEPSSRSIMDEETQGNPDEEMRIETRTRNSIKLKSRSACWSDNLRRCRLYCKNETCEEGQRLGASPDLCRTRKHFEHAMKTRQYSARQ